MIDLLQRLLFAAMFLRLTEEGVLRLGPKSRVQVHWHLRQLVHDNVDGLTEMMHDLRIANMFGNSTEVTSDLERAMALFVDDMCEVEDGALLSGFTLHRVVYPWIYTRGEMFPTQAQLYAALDKTYRRFGRVRSSDAKAPITTVAQWRGLRIKPEFVTKTYGPPVPPTKYRAPSRAELAAGITGLVVKGNNHEQAA